MEAHVLSMSMRSMVAKAISGPVLEIISLFFIRVYSQTHAQTPSDLSIPHWQLQNVGNLKEMLLLIFLPWMLLALMLIGPFQRA